jgi:hypothetical protein
MGDPSALAEIIARYIDLPANPFESAAPSHLARHTAAEVAAAYVKVFEEQAPRRP